jgi:hypothetical protein
MSCLAVALAAALLQPPSPSPRPAAGPSAPREVAIERLEWSRAVDGAEPITAIEIRNDFGDIRARPAGDRTLVASMVVQRLDPGPQRVGYSVERRGSTVALVVGYPGRVQDADPLPRKDGYDRLDLAIYIPAGVALRAHTTRGLVEARGLRGDVEAATLDGSILLSASGTIRARTDTGDLTATVSAEAFGAPGPPLLFETRSGAINLILPAEGNAEVRVETSAAVTSKVDLRRRAAGARTKATATLGAGERLVLVRSDTGRVHIDR